MSDTIAAVATGGSVSAIGIVRVSGPLSAPLMDALFRPADGKAMSQHRDRQLVYGKLLDEKGRTLDLCLCTLSRAPRSYTGEDTAELAGGVARRERRFRVDDIDDGLRLREIHAPV